MNDVLTDPLLPDCYHCFAIPEHGDWRLVVALYLNGRLHGTAYGDLYDTKHAALAAAYEAAKIALVMREADTRQPLGAPRGVEWSES